MSDDELGENPVPSVTQRSLKESVMTLCHGFLYSVLFQEKM